MRRRLPLTREWILCIAGLSAALLLLFWQTHVRWQSAAAMAAAMGIAAMGCGLFRIVPLGILLLIGAISGFFLPKILGTVTAAFLFLLLGLMLFLWWNTPFSATRAREGLVYRVRGQEHVLPTLAFDGSRPLLLRQDVIDALANAAEFADRFLTRHGIRYIAVYGTALGALRHGGLIPWDDDIDFSIYRPEDLNRLETDFEALAADAAREGYVLFRHSGYWKLAAGNFWRYPAVDLYVKAGDPDPAAKPVRMQWEDFRLCVAPDCREWIARKYGPEALTHVVHGIPFWDSGFVPAFMTRLFGYRVLSVAASAVTFLFAPRGV